MFAPFMSGLERDFFPLDFSILLLGSREILCLFLQDLCCLYPENHLGHCAKLTLYDATVPVAVLKVLVLVPNVCN